MFIDCEVQDFRSTPPKSGYQQVDKILKQKKDTKCWSEEGATVGDGCKEWASRRRSGLGRLQDAPSGTPRKLAEERDVGSGLPRLTWIGLDQHMDWTLHIRLFVFPVFFPPFFKKKVPKLWRKNVTVLCIRDNKDH